MAHFLIDLDDQFFFIAFLLVSNRLPTSFSISSTNRIGADHINTIFQSAFVSGICREKEK